MNSAVLDVLAEDIGISSRMVSWLAARDAGVISDRIVAELAEKYLNDYVRRVDGAAPLR